MVEADAAAYVGDLGPAEYRRFFVRFTDVYEVLWGLGLMVPVGLGCGGCGGFLPATSKLTAYRVADNRKQGLIRKL